jgi:hypothetical protein
VDELQPTDLCMLGWSGSRLHLEHVATALARVQRDETGHTYWYESEVILMRRRL